MKKLLLLFGIALTGAGAFAQGASCAAATTVTSGSTYVMAPIASGTYVNGCNSDTAPNGKWYKFTAPSGGMIKVDATLAVNPGGTTGVDTAVHVFSGTCGTLACVAFNDDSAAADYRSLIADLVVTAGTTYYIEWDNRWQDNVGFSWQFTFTPVSCFAPTGFTYVPPAPTTTSVALGWTAPAQGLPEGYQFEWGPIGFTQGTGTLISTTDTSVVLSTLSPNSVYDFYIRTDCGLGDYSIWEGPISFSTEFDVASVPYNTSFEEANFGFVGWTQDAPTGYAGQAWRVYNAGPNTPLTQEGERSALVFAGAAADGNNDVWLLSRGLNLAANSPVTVTYYIRNYLATGSTGSTTYELKAGTTQDVAGMTIPIAAETVTDVAFAQKTFNFTPTTAGTYFLGFHSTNVVNAGTQATFLDNVTVSQVLGTEDVFASQFAVYPNPATSTVNISNTTDALITNVKVTDLKGRTVKNNNFVASSNIQINTSDLSSGVYMLNITSDKGTAVKKIVKK
ncbi:T9SS type A sorting domain-containing protein [Flavobacterium pallidum]|uniref:Fibronectin type-III domain-containing protein n=1 Tax=Flavobacterium pallidum TaxID=2172098 RepID=A0A2S1SGG8_9FLAO|nr:T9SS type A sorting domain-containing protein [Flavobacterium pallidum]AWI25504.1 hypothetical protein HYN49_06110 [Flavobacterium pallidum]